MEKNFEIQDNLLWIKMPRELDHHMAAYIREEADQNLLNSKVEHVVFNFEETQFMDSSGIGVIVGRYKLISQIGGKVIVYHPNSRIKKMMLLSGLKDYIEIVEE